MASKGALSAAFGDITRFLNRRIEEIDNQAGHAVFVATNVGRQKMQEIIESTTSKTGEARAARGGHPGRIDSGNMIDSVEHDIHVRGNLEHREHIGEWGWLNDFEDYFGLQDQWPGLPAGAMNALHQSHIAAREALIEELKK